MILLARYWRILAAAALVAALLSLYSWRISKAEQAGYERATADMAARVAKANAETAGLEQRQRAQSDKAAQAWEKNRNDLQSQVDRLLTVTRPSLRVCRPASAAPVSSAASPAGSADDAARGSVDAMPSQRDIGIAMVQFGGDCERYRRQLISLQDWIKSSSNP